MSKFSSFERQLTIATAGITPDAINAKLAAFAKRELQRVISSGQASATYTRYVNRIEGASEETVRAPGPIIYDFVNWPIVVREALREIRMNVPLKSGRYSNSFIVLANQNVVRDFSQIPAQAEVIIINTQPYTRKMDSGAPGFASVGRRHFEKAKNKLSRTYKGNFSFDVLYLSLSNGIQNGVPYILKRGGRRKDRQAGMPITYPALIINAL